jgi:hypothetical protein
VKLSNLNKGDRVNVDQYISKVDVQFEINHNVEYLEEIDYEIDEIIRYLEFLFLVELKIADINEKIELNIFIFFKLILKALSTLDFLAIKFTSKFLLSPSGVDLRSILSQKYSLLFS